MNQATLAALQGSIKKWEKVVDGAGEENGSCDCPLCHEFMEEDECGGCPIAEAAGEGCANEEWMAWFRHKDNAHGSSFEPFKVQCPECIRLAQAELDFLKGLLPKESE